MNISPFSGRASSLPQLNVAPPLGQRATGGGQGRGWLGKGDGWQMSKGEMGGVIWPVPFVSTPRGG